MIKKGIKEVRDHFTMYLRQVKKGEEVMVTERGRPVALIRSIPEGAGLKERLELASIKGLIRLPKVDENIPVHKKVNLRGKSLTEIILEEREIGW